jgi:DNA-binding phage protein
MDIKCTVTVTQFEADRLHAAAPLRRQEWALRARLYKTLAPGTKPRFETIATIMRALKVGFS